VQALLQGVQQMRHGPGTDTMPLPLRLILDSRVMEFEDGVH
jgi:hypothetical protein